MTRGAYRHPRRNPRGDWATDAACADRPDVAFFPPLTDRQAPKGWDAQARAICATCPVRCDCLTEAISNGERWGIWGGLDPKERQALGTIRRAEKCL